VDNDEGSSDDLTPPGEGGAQLFSFDVVTPGTLTPGARAAIDLALAEGDSGTEAAITDLAAT